MRIGGEAAFRRGNADAGELVEHLAPRRRPCERRMQQHRLHHLVADWRHGIEARHRLLEDHADPAAAHVAHLGDRQLQEIAALEQDAASCFDATRSRYEVHDGQGRHGFAAA